MAQQSKGVTFKGSPLTLVGNMVEVGQQAPDVELVTNDLSTVKLSDYRGKVLIVATVPSLDTAVCDTETRRFNQEAAKLGDDVRVLTVSLDLPFAQKRWCGAAGVDRVQTLSDYRGAKLGNAWGLLIKELHLLARAVFVLDGQGVVRYAQLVGEVASEPEYAPVLDAAKKLV